ncbi:Morn repeat protein [Pandoravirus inopinatum]|uniref:Morn repeat protein n=1 Tax=Pandoravirus inopinatum TaxID=1605721 RepID=A0A0B5J246_9VIRU|nr:Morn repeat protein [Pandoravirus inopinatum]AJF97619.1 Morn repeat protein [Pandoravirus inopinatum]
MASFLGGTGPVWCPSDLLPVELWWAIVDALLSTRHGVLDVARLGLVSRFLASMIFGDEGAWAFRCRRDLGATESPCTRSASGSGCAGCNSMLRPPSTSIVAGPTGLCVAATSRCRPFTDVPYVTATIGSYTLLPRRRRVPTPRSQA